VSEDARNDRAEIFRNRLVAVVSDLNSGEDRNPELRRTVGMLAHKLHSDARAQSWADLKQRADGPTYDSLLKVFQAHSESATKAGDTLGVKALELLAISMIARRQGEMSLEPGIEYLDNFIADCERQARPSAVHKPRPMPS
jgi:hypothetical protein